MLGERGLELGGHQCGVAGDLEEVVEASAQGVSLGVVEVKAPADAASEGQQVGVPKALGQSRVAGEDDAQQLLGVEAPGGEDPQLAEDVGEHLLGFVDDEHGAGERACDVVAPALSERFEAAPAVVALEGDAEEVAELAVEVAAAALRVVDGSDLDVAHLPETVGEQAKCDALATAGVTRDHHEASVGECQRHASGESVDFGRWPQRLDGCAGPKGVKGQPVMGQ